MRSICLFVAQISLFFIINMPACNGAQMMVMVIIIMVIIIIMATVPLVVLVVVVTIIIVVADGPAARNLRRAFFGALVEVHRL